jgi:electron transport complex protein RnfE
VKSPKNRRIAEELRRLLNDIGMGLGFLFGMTVIGAVREVLDMGTFLGYDLLGFRPILFFVLPAAGFFTVGFMMAIFNYAETIYKRQKRS